jgi:cytochrome b6-f complex iron-sulfur subunit
MEKTSRRKFLAAGLGCIGAALAGGVLYPIYKYLAPRRTGGNMEKVSFPESDLTADGAKFFDFSGSTGVVVRKKGGDLVAFSAVCTHLGCIVQWEKEKQDFLCPCHGGRYTADGTVVSGPPPRPLQKLAFTLANGTITVG